jgi:hypothetical protein
MGVSLGVVGRKPINAVLGHPKKNMLLLLILAYLRRDTKGNNSITRKFFFAQNNITSCYYNGLAGVSLIYFFHNLYKNKIFSFFILVSI